MGCLGAGEVRKASGLGGQRRTGQGAGGRSSEPGRGGGAGWGRREELRWLWFPEDRDPRAQWRLAPRWGSRGGGEGW